MRALLLFAVVGAALAVPTPIEEPITRDNSELAAAYVLPTTSYPTFYDVRLFIDPDYPDNFYGNVTIRIVANEATNEIVMHAMELEIYSISVTADLDNTDLVVGYTLAEDDTFMLRIALNAALVAYRPYTVNINYAAKYATNMFGVYLSTYQENGQNVNLVTSQLQPTYARRAFPCYDEPHLKAIFRTTIYAPPAYQVVRTNMPLRTDELRPNVTGYTKHEFQDTLVMSSYLIAYLVSNLESVGNEVSPLYRIPFRVYSRPELLPNTEFALDFGQKNMVALEEYTEFPYEFPKLDNVAVPDFAAGAMENWGLIVYREVALLVQEGVTTTSVLQNIGRIITHENMHQWFGNEVSPLSWTFTWLNEGFANFFESFATDMVLPEWRMMDQFRVTMQSTFQADAVLTVNPMTYEVYTPSQIIGTFNAIAYQKSGSVIHMMQHFLTPEVFRRGLVRYLRQNSRKAVGPSDLYAAFQQALDESDHSIPFTVAAIMDRWANQGGFPVVNVRRNSPTAESVSVDQERYLTDRSLSSNYRWHIPINWVLSTNPDFSSTAPQAWVDPISNVNTFTIPGLSGAEWFIVNKLQTGYYRVNYDNDNWAALARLLTSSHQTVHFLNRAQLIDDAFNLARNGRLSYEFPLELSMYLVDEQNYIPWASANAALSYLNNVLGGTETYGLFQQYILHLTATQYEALGFTAASNEEHVTAYHRNIILNFNCRFGNQDCLDTAAELLQNFRDNPANAINPDIQTNVFCYGLRGGDTDNFNFLWERFQNTQDSSEQSILLSAMGCTTNTQTRTFYMNQVITDSSPVREQDRHSILVSTVNAGGDNTEAALDFIVENWLEIQPRVQGLTGTTNILNALANMLTTQEHLEKINTFYNRYENNFSAGELASIGRIRENIAASITWNNEYLDSVDAWLKTNFSEDDSGAATATSNLAVFITVAAALYNLL